MIPITMAATNAPAMTKASVRKTNESEGFAEALQQAATKPSGDTTLKLSEISFTIPQMRERMEQSLASFKREFDTFLSQAGIDASEPIGLQVGTDGRILVSGNNPDKAKIERYFAEHPQVERYCHAAICCKEMLVAAEEGLEFQAAYHKDPKAAIAHYSHLFNQENVLTLLVQKKADELEYEFLKGSRPRGTLANF